MVPNKRLPGFSGEWEKCLISDVAKIFRGASPRPISDKKWFSSSSNIGWVRISDVTRAGKYLTETQQRLSESGVAKSRFVKSDSLIMSICATVGKPVITKIDACIHDGFVVFDSPSANLDYLYFYLLMLEDSWADLGQTGSQMNLNTDLINNTKLLIPPLDEQRAIADLLTTWDEAIEANEQLLANSQQRKQALMQQLLTGKKRLPGFSGEWVQQKLSSTGKVVSGGTPDTTNEEYWDGDILWLTPTDVTALKNKHVKNTYRKITALGLKNSSARMIPANSVMVCTRASVGDVSISTTEICTNQGFKSIIPNTNFDSVFLYFILSNNKKKLVQLSSGSTFLELSKSDFDNITFSFPPLDEQRAIADVLSSADDEIETIQQRIDNLKAQKKGLMQQLLSGKVGV